jgi:hypothetical protein
VSVALSARSWACACFLVALCAGCDLDPIAKHNLCEGPGPISANCKQCQQPPYAAGCPQCQDDPNDGQCAPPTLPNMPSTEPPDATTTGAIDGGDRSGVGGHSGLPPNTSGGSGGRSPDNRAGSGAGATSGAGNPAGGSGNIAPPPIGGAAADGGAPLTPGTCRNDADCGGATPGCLPGAQRCVPCTMNEHCGEGMVCDTGNLRCVQCMSGTDCGPDAVCDTSQQRCFQCMLDSDCHDSIKSTCNMSSRECVDCDEGRGCAAPTPVCNGDTCVECTSDSTCSGVDHRCTSDNRCVECLARDGDCKVDGKPVCIVEEQRCVQCIAPTDCRDPAASRCNSNNTCVGCSADADCTHLADTPVCDIAAHRCVQCKTVYQCGDYACVPSTHSCSSVARRSLDKCASCESDEQCQSGNCIPMMFSNHDIGSFCLDAQDLVTSQNCHVDRPYSRTLIDQPTIDGATATVCAPPDRTTCAGVLDAKNSKSCSGSAQCGIGMGLIDSTCTAGRCSYVCTDDYDCPDSLPKCGQGGQCSPLGS